MRLTHFILILWASPFLLSANNNPSKTARQNYIDQFAPSAVIESQRSRIPASIILAQGILESGSGKSQLALESLNHFGIKCNGWKGRKVYHYDDDFDKNGKKIKSCFRAYDNVLESYADHSEFLMTRPRYAKLFQLSSIDYVGWARGLKECGYATEPKYAELLIKIIEENALYIYDQMEFEAVVITTPTSPAPVSNQVTTPMPLPGSTTSNAVMESPQYKLPVAHQAKKKTKKNRVLPMIKLATFNANQLDRPMRHAVAAR